MNSSRPPTEPLDHKEPIPGYRLTERIGAGGYGEVWKAEAPGGLVKAVKLIYGYLDDHRASAELKALNRIKQCRHPFLLSLERIEAVNDHLFIVTELADSCLKDRFEECRDEGLAGIPREELLGYLGDAGDALDYIREKFSLQHLDIKPENLLLVGERIKVADFGLVRDVQGSGGSLLGGLTPVYAPPELFDGRPCGNSDQYSLAIVYQEMLTGTLPFTGRTTAQLAAQHIHSAPRLQSLPPQDQATISRALAKDPQARFASCREMINDLVDASESASRQSGGGRSRGSSRVPQYDTSPSSVGDTRPSGQASRDGERPSTDTIILEGRSAPGAAIFADEEVGGLTSIPPQTGVEELPPLDTDACPAVYRPTLYLGIGGIAARTLRRLRRRLHDRFGDLAAIPALQMLLLDTNVKDVNESTRGQDSSALDISETLSLPLRSPHDYRSDSKKFLQTLSRRWLYNIPRSLQTEGIRPLGRLALVDHMEVIFDRIRQAVEDIMSPEAIAQTSKHTGLEFRTDLPRIVVLASISGGTGSGMVLDVVYAVRRILSELGYTPKGLCGILTHSTQRKASARDLAMANAFAFLTELRHFSRPGGFYPGDTACGLPASDGTYRTFHDAYLVHLGDELNDEETLAAVDRLADYVFRSTVSEASGFFERCRELEHHVQQGQEDERGPLTLRTFGLSQIGSSQTNVQALAGEVLCKTLARVWRGDAEAALESGPRKLSEADSVAATGRSAKEAVAEVVDSAAAARAAQLRLDFEKILEFIYGVVHDEMGSEAETYFSEVLSRVLGVGEQAEIGQQEALSAFADTLDGILGHVQRDQENASEAVSVQAVIGPRFRKLADDTTAAIRDFVFSLADAAESRLAGAQHAAEWFRQHLRSLDHNASEQLTRTREDMHRTAAALHEVRPGQVVHSKDRGFHGTTEGQQLLLFAQLRLHETVLLEARRFLSRVIGETTTLSEDLRHLHRDLNQLADAFDGSWSTLETMAARDDAGTLDDVRSSLAEALCSRKKALVERLDEKVAAERFAGRSILREVVERGIDVGTELPRDLRAAAYGVVREALRELDLLDLVLNSGDDAGAGRPLQDCLEAATPRLAELGGRRRLLLIVPQPSGQSQMQQELCREVAKDATVVADRDNDVILCYEVEGLPFDAVAASLIGERPDYAQLASRLHTRIDVHWSPIRVV